MDERNVASLNAQRTVMAALLAAAGILLLAWIGIDALASRQQDPVLQATDFSAKPVSVRYAAPKISLTGLDGGQHSLTDYSGQVVVINLWATWCPPCEAEMPVLQAYFEKHQNDGFTIVAIEDGEPASDVLAFVKRLGLTFPVWLDPTHQATDHAFKTMNLPTSFVIDRAGIVRLTWLGAISAANLEKCVTPIIRER